MKRKIIGFLCALTILCCMTGCNETSPYDKLVSSSPKSIQCTTATVDSVELLSEYIVVVPKISKDSKVLATEGVASFQIDDKIYLFGYPISEAIGSRVVKIDKFNPKLERSNLIGEVISNTDNGVIAERSNTIREYSSISIAKTAELGEAFIVERDENGDICKKSITIEAFKEDQNIFFYSSSEVQFGGGLGGYPIIQNGELIGVHFGSTEDGIGVGRIIWNLEMLLP